jgi:hypothetical protein
MHFPTAFSSTGILPFLLLNGLFLAYLGPWLLRFHDLFVAPLRTMVSEQFARWMD